MPHPCEECGFYMYEDGRPICHNKCAEGFKPSETVIVYENDEGVTYCGSCGRIICTDGYGNFPDNCPSCDGTLDWRNWQKDGTPSGSAGDYGPGDPWDAPGMGVRDFM